MFILVLAPCRKSGRRVPYSKTVVCCKWKNTANVICVTKRAARFLSFTFVFAQYSRNILLNSPFKCYLAEKLKSGVEDVATLRKTGNQSFVTNKRFCV